MKEPMKYLIIALAFLATTAHAKLPGVPSDNETCRQVGAIYAAAYILSNAGHSKSDSIKLMTDATKAKSPAGRLPAYAPVVITAAWKTASENTGANPDTEEQRVRAMCLER